MLVARGSGIRPMKQITLTLLLLLAAIPVQAEQSVAHRPTVGEMVNDCRPAVSPEIDKLPKDLVADAFMCIGLLRGFVDGLTTAGMICHQRTPSSLDYLRLAFVYIKYASMMMMEDETNKDKDWSIAMFSGVVAEGWLCPGAWEQMNENLRRRMQ